MEQPLAGAAWLCQECGISVPGGSVSPGACGWCGKPTVELDDAFWGRISATIRRAWQRDPELLGRVKADAGGRLPPMLPEPLLWLYGAWERTGRPGGHPFEAERHFRIDFVMRFLTRPTGWLIARKGWRFRGEDGREVVAEEDELLRIQGGLASRQRRL